MNSFPEIETRRLILRQFQNNDLENVYNGLSHPDVIKYYGVNYANLEQTREQLLWFKNLENEGTGIWWAITDKVDSQFLGAIGFNNLSKKDKRTEIGFWLMPAYWRLGIISEAAIPACDYVFKHLDVNIIEAFVESENENSKKLLSKLAFRYVETLVNCEVKNDQLISLLVFSKSKIR